MERQFEFLEITRSNILKEIESCTVEQLFEIPKGFNNHILWNAIHVIVTQQLLIYGNTGTPFRINQSIIDKYRKGTTPTAEVDMEMVDFVKSNFISTIAITKEDYNNKIFGNYNTITTSYNTTLTNVEDAICFINLHDSMHYGQIKMLRKLLQQ